MNSSPSGSRDFGRNVDFVDIRGWDGRCSGDKMAATEIAMPAFHGHDDDFPYQIQHPPAETPGASVQDTTVRI